MAVRDEMETFEDESVVFMIGQRANPAPGIHIFISIDIKTYHDEYNNLLKVSRFRNPQMLAGVSLSDLSRSCRNNEPFGEKSMKTILTSIFLFLSINASAQDRADHGKLEMLPGAFVLKDEPNAQPTGCDINSRLILDNGQIMGKFAYLTDFVDGFCEIYVNPNPRLFTIYTTESIGCGSVKHTGRAQLDNGTHTIEIIDHRTRLCEDLIPYLIKATIKNYETTVQVGYH